MKVEEGDFKEDIFDVEEEDELLLLLGFFDEESFEGFICYKCVELNLWIKYYVGIVGFLVLVFFDGGMKSVLVLVVIVFYFENVE